VNTKYIDFINQTFDFPQEEFKLNSKQELLFHDINLMKLIKEYDTPLRFTYLPQISNKIQQSKKWFNDVIKKNNYKGSYQYCYCTKSSHFKHVIEEALKNNIHIEASSAFDINIVQNLKNERKINNDTYVICNGFKRTQYIDNIVTLINGGHKNCIPIIDNYKELELLEEKIEKKFQVGIRIASEEEPNFEFYTSRLGIGYKDIINFYREKIKGNKLFSLKMLHFYINSGIKDNVHYWNELNKCLSVYTALKKLCPTLDSLNIGGGFPIKNSLAFVLP